jgi:uncharacterized protein
MIRIVHVRVVRISIAPVKALALVHPEEVEIGPQGVVGDRRFWLRDATGRLFNAKREGRLIGIRPEWDESSRRLALVFPDGVSVDGVVELGEEIDAVMYGAPRPSRRVVGPWQDAISDFVGRPLELLWSNDGGADRLVDGGTVSLVSRASLERLREELGVSAPVDGRRFRMLFELDGLGPHEEDTWIGRPVQIGEAEIVVNGDVGRCVVTSRDPDTGIADLPTLVALAAYRREGRDEPLPFGVKGTVSSPGYVRLGDRATPL